MSYKVENNGWTVDAVGPGWKDLVEPLIALCNVTGATVNQIKEKFGTLRFYHTNGADPLLTSAVRAAVTQMEARSAKICEECGRTNNTWDKETQSIVDDVYSGGSWIKTLCKKCHELRQEQRPELYRNFTKTEDV